VNQYVAALGFGLVTSSIIALGAVGFNMQFSVTRIFNVAIGSTMAASAYIAYAANSLLGLNIWIALLVGGAAGAVISLLLQTCIYTPFLRRGSGVFTLIMASLAVSVIIQYVIQAIAGPSFFQYRIGQDRSVRLGSIVWTRNQVIVMLVALAAMVAIELLLKMTRLGKAMRATAADPDLARNSGINADRITSIAWAVSGFLSGMAGVVLALNTVAFTTDTSISFMPVVAVAAIVAGSGEPVGAMIGAVALGLSTEMVAVWHPELKNAAAFVLLVMMLILRPNGLKSIGSIRGESGLI
jgi:branched-subunit amino acid ABC-type transport system permease component